jgi:hypothetical protein
MLLPDEFIVATSTVYHDASCDGRLTIAEHWPGALAGHSFELDGNAA